MPAKTVIHFLTSNPLKFRRAKSVFESASIELLKLTPTSPEIQADTPLEIAKYGAKLEANIHNFPVLREDHGLYIEGFMNEKFP